MPATPVVRAAGVVCLRERPGGHSHDEPAATEVLLIHRTQLRDWSLPKGKLDRGEHVAVAAVREAAEETGYAVRLGMPLKTQRYPVGERTKEVSYWLARVVGQGAWAPNHEVDEVRWVDVREAAALLTYPRDADLVKSAAKKPRGTSPLVILRHAQAEKRRDFARGLGTDVAPDALRPLSRVGERQAADLVPVLSAFGVTSVHSSPSVRCHDTVLPFALADGIDIVDEPRLSEEGFVQARKKALKRVTELMLDPAPQVVCSHRPVLPAIFEQLRPYIGTGLDPDLPPGGFVVIHRDFSAGKARVVAAERHAP